MSNPKSSTDLNSVTFSPESGPGLTHSDKLDGPTTGQSGQAAARASLSARQAMGQGLMMSGTYGQPGSTSLASAALQSSLESRLAQGVHGRGSILYKLTWRRWITPSGVSRSRLRASVRRTLGTGATGLRALPTPTARDHRGRMSMDLMERRKSHARGVALPEYMQREIGKVGYLNPELPRLLMGLPREWDECAAMAMQSIQKPPKRL